MLFALSIAIDAIYTKCTQQLIIFKYIMLKYQDFPLFILLIANSGNYLHLSIVVHYKTVRNNNVLSVNYSLKSNY